MPNLPNTPSSVYPVSPRKLLRSHRKCLLNFRLAIPTKRFTEISQGIFEYWVRKFLLAITAVIFFYGHGVFLVLKTQSFTKMTH
jgi:hypothetical protein